MSDTMHISRKITPSTDTSLSLVGTTLCVTFSVKMTANPMWRNLLLSEVSLAMDAMDSSLRDLGFNIPT